MARLAFRSVAVGGLIELMGCDRLLMGSDWPHAEGLADPLSYLEDLDGFDQAAVDKIMHDNAAELAVPSVA